MARNYSAIRAGRQLKGPEDRIQELRAAKVLTIAEARSGEAKRQGYDPRVRLQSINSEIARLTPPPGGFPQPK